MKILLIAINSNNRFTPLALLYLKVSLLNDIYLKERIYVEIKEFDPLDTDESILYEVQKYNPQIIGFSCYVWNIEKILSLSNKIKKIKRKAAIILGGPQVSPIAKALLEENSQIDAIVRGEGEVSFLELTRSSLDYYKGIKKILGITYRYKGKVVNNLDREIISNLDSIPPVYSSNLISLENREVCLETQRGCIFKCHFCYYNKDFNKIRFFSMVRVKKDLSFLLKQKLKSIYLMDPVFNVDVNRAKEICKFIAQNNKNNILVHSEIKAELVDKELAELFHKAHVKYLEIGLQSSKNKVLKLVNRRLNTQKFVNGINLLKKYDLTAEIQLILGLPGDTFHSFKKSLEFALSLEPKALLISRLQVLPGTEIWRKANELGIIYEKDPPHYFLQSKSLPFSKMIGLTKIINSINLFRTKLTFKYLCKETKIKFLDIIELWIDWLNDDAFLLKPQNSDILKDKLKGFISYLCEKNNIDFKFYENFLQREIMFSMQNEKEQTVEKTGNTRAIQNGN
ncbi:MAG: radical SAM protein [Candidatus Omnitrophota bacterium]